MNIYRTHHKCNGESLSTSLSVFV